MTEGATASCPWCKAPFRPRRGGSPQRFCGSKCRTEFWIALRRWGERAISVGILTIADIKNGDPAACTLAQDSANVAGGYVTPPIPLMRFLVEVECDTVTWLVRLGFIPPTKRDDLAAIIAALKRIGRAPEISRIA